MDRNPAVTRQTANMRWVLKHTFKKNEFRLVDELEKRVNLLTPPHSPLQREVIASVIEGQDVFLQACTSFGKSLCYQLPAVLKDWGCEF